MDIHISGRGVDVPASLRRRVETKLGKVERFLPKIVEARVVLGLEKYRHLAEVTLQAKRSTFRVEEASTDFRTAMDLALEKLEQQVRRRKDRIQRGKPRVSPKLRLAQPAARETETGGPAGAPDVIVRRSTGKPMSLEEAIDQIRLRGDSLLVFTNATTRTVNVLRRLGDGRLEIIEPSG